MPRGVGMVQFKHGSPSESKPLHIARIHKEGKAEESVLRKVSVFRDFVIYVSRQTYSSITK